MKVSASYMVKNEEEYLSFSIESIYQVVNEIIIVDNGSTDKTVEIAKSYDKVKLFYSQDENFSNLRNLTISKASGDWILIMCADEVFYEYINEILPQLIRDPQADGFYCWYYHLMRSYYYMQNKSDRDLNYHRLFLLRNVPGLKYVQPVHQYVTGIGSNLKESDLHYVHYGYVKPPQTVYQKFQQYYKLENKSFPYEVISPENILHDRPLYPFYREHPRVIIEHVRSKAEEEVRKGNKLFRKPPYIGDPEVFSDAENQIAGTFR